MSKPSKHLGGLPHNGVFVAESKLAQERDEYLRTATDVRLVTWDDERICYSGIDANGEIFDKYWTPRPPEEDYEVRNDYKPHSER
ncbi:hypothetical protein SEA_ATUIN_247 [Arthrobacter phage Atuin]|nr:hypothetical protein SEA_ATUIN_46 [Arthrobacter phage Atuin]